MKRQLEQRLAHLEARQQHLSIVRIAERMAPEAGIDVQELVVETEATLAECRRQGITTPEAMIEYLAARDEIDAEEFRREMDGLGVTAR